MVWKFIASGMQPSIIGSQQGPKKLLMSFWTTDHGHNSQWISQDLNVVNIFVFLKIYLQLYQIWDSISTCIKTEILNYRVFLLKLYWRVWQNKKFTKLIFICVHVVKQNCGCWAQPLLPLKIIVFAAILTRGRILAPSF